MTLGTFARAHTSSASSRAYRWVDAGTYSTEFVRVGEVEAGE